MSKTYLIVGGSSGIGLELVKQLSGRGEKVIVTVRKRESSQTGVDEISSVPGDVTILEGIDIAQDDVGKVLVSALGESTKIDVVVHNAGSMSGTRDVDGAVFMSEQKLDVITMDRMRMAYEVNALGPLRVQQALQAADTMVSPGGKVGIISTGLSSIDDNTSGGSYAYRASKTAVNMIAKCLSCDLKEKQIAVMVIAPGFVVTEFGPGAEAMKKWGAMPVQLSVQGIVTLLDDTMTMENTGKFYSVVKDGTTKEKEW